ncbi:MAG: DUF1704 domain-containing protein [Candidatus Wallbacteria bacterium]|nr:DUF1704 domain-containing protein [Candidatus Wallbacteria bacterium]
MESQTDSDFHPKISPKILQVDRVLYRLAKKCKILYYINPVNSAAEKARFLERYARGRKYIPHFRYRQLPFDIAATTSELTQLDRLLDGSELGELYRRKIDELNTQLLLLNTVGQTQKFMGYSIALYGTPALGMVAGVKPLDVAKIWLAAPRNREDRCVPPVSYNPLEWTVRKDLLDEANYYGFPCAIRVKDHLSSNAAAGEQSISLRRGILYSRKESLRLKVHEVGFHLLTTFNARRHPLRIFEIGTPGYLSDQEGGAIWAEEESRAITNHRLAVLGARTLGIHMAVSGADFHEVFDCMVADYGFDEEDAYYVCERVFRGGVYTKDAIYQQGYYRVRSHIRFGLVDPYVFINGKMSIDAVPLVKSLMDEEILEKPRFVPRFLQDEDWIHSWKTLSVTSDLHRSEALTRRPKREDDELATPGYGLPDPKLVLLKP